MRKEQHLVCPALRCWQRWDHRNDGVIIVRFEELGSNVLMFVGDDHESVATAFLNGNDVLLVDSLGSLADASWLRRVLCEDMGKTVRVVAATHFMSDHIAGMSLFPDALTIAHRHHRHTFLSQNRRVDAFYREPQVVFDSAMTVRWGQHELVAQSIFALDTAIASRARHA